MGLHDGHRQRSKRRYLALGAEGMEDHQLLELRQDRCMLSVKHWIVI